MKSLLAAASCALLLVVLAVFGSAEGQPEIDKEAGFLDALKQGDTVFLLFTDGLDVTSEWYLVVADEEGRKVKANEMWPASEYEVLNVGKDVLRLRSKDRELFLPVHSIHRIMRYLPVDKEE